MFQVTRTSLFAHAALAATMRTLPSRPGMMLMHP
jgi:hypothetical protein